MKIKLIQMFYAALNEKGRAGFVMANSASDARASEQEIRQKLIESKAVDVMIAVSSNFFYTVTLPCSLWFFDKAKKGTDREDKVLFVDARHIFRQVTRAVRDYTSEQLNFIANIVRIYRGEGIDNIYLNQHPEEANNGEWAVDKHFPDGQYQDIAGLCKVATIEEIKAQGWSLNPGRYVGVAAGEEEHDEDFVAKILALQEELETLNLESHKLEREITLNLSKVMGS
ncbi:N-6 DNA methylase [Neptuniibacter sp. QD48_11]|uniref:N-6 DNA methylase n=1 Tax=Neptuniibacter sp. QD48_11 TaxID=3398211 RepID=UPI0039F613F2